MLNEADENQRRDAAADPIVVPNTFWTAADPEAYRGGQQSDSTHLAEFEASGLGRRDNARWSGALEVIPTRADVVLDLIRMKSLGLELLEVRRGNSVGPRGVRPGRGGA